MMENGGSISKNNMPINNTFSGMTMIAIPVATFIAALGWIAQGIVQVKKDVDQLIAAQTIFLPELEKFSETIVELRTTQRANKVQIDECHKQFDRIAAWQLKAEDSIGTFQSVAKLVESQYAKPMRIELTDRTKDILKSILMDKSDE